MKKQIRQLREYVSELWPALDLPVDPEELWASILELFDGLEIAPGEVGPEDELCIGEIDGIAVCLLDGGEVKKVYTDFVEGGHDLIYDDLVPSDTVWIDCLLDASQWPFVAFHELLERQLMALGYGYDFAHDIANDIEGSLRSSS